MMDFKVNIGEMTEDEVQRSVEDCFSPLFVFRAPRKEDGDEVTDVLVPWNDVGLVIQVKSQAVSPTGEPPGDSLKWAEKNLRKAGRQVRGAVRAIRAGRMTHMENALRGRLRYPKDEISWLYGVIVLHHVSPAFDPFRLVPELKDAGVALHVLSFRDLWNLARFLDTPGDLVNYLEHRSSVLVPTLQPRVHEEEDIFRYYVRNLEKIMAFRAKERGESFTEDDARTYAEKMRRLFTGKLPDVGAGQVIDDMIDRAHERDPNLGPIRVGETIVEMEPASSVKVATELSAIPRVRRIALGRRYLRTVQLAAKQGSDAWKSTHSPNRSDCMLFLASTLSKGQRGERQKRLLGLTDLLKHYHQVKKAIGIATEAGVGDGRSYDFVYLEGEPIADHEASLAAKEFFGEAKTPLAGEPESG